MTSGSKLAACLTLVAFLTTACSDTAGPGGGDDVLSFANSTDAEVNVALTFPNGSKTSVTLPASRFGEETPVAVSFVEGDVYTFVLSNPAPSIAPSPETSCTVAAAAERDGVAAVLVLFDTQQRSFRGQCLTNWVES